MKLYLVIVFFTLSCVSKKKTTKEVFKDPSQAEEGISLNTKVKRTGSDFPRKSYVFSLSKDPLTNKKIKEKDLNRFRMNGGTGENLESIYSLINIYAMSNKPVNRSLAMIQRAAEYELKDDLKNSIDDRAVVDICLQALAEKNYKMVFFLLRKMMASDSLLVQAKAYNLRGVIFKNDNRNPEAIANWEKSLSMSPEYLPSSMNLAFSYLKYGYVKKANEKLSLFEDDWLATSAKAIVERSLGNGAQTSKECAFLLKSYPNHKPTLFNCGLNELRTNKNKIRAKQLIGKALEIKGGKSEWDDQAYKILEEI